MQPSLPQIPGPSSQPKKGWSGCLIAALVVLGLVLIVGGVAFWGAYRYMTQGTGQKVVGLFGEAMRASQQAQTAPGTAELRAAGCQVAMVMDLERMKKLGREIGARTKTVNSGGADLAVYCALGNTPLTCDQVASIYAKAVGGKAARAFVATVGAGDKADCSRRYSAEGTLLGEAPASEVGSPGDMVDDIEPDQVHLDDDRPLIDHPAEKEESPGK